MLAPLKWLNSYVKVENVDQAVDALLQAGLEVEEIFDYKKEDKVLKVEVTPNRGDWASIYGIAREISAITKKDLKKLEIELPLESKLFTGETLKVNIKAKKACSKYIAYLLKDINNSKESPKELKTSLEKLGEKSINLVVDSTNYSMFDSGQPLHAFDKDKVNGDITVRFASKGEKINLINNKLIDLTKDDLIVADESGPIALAGVMGGKRTEVSTKTKKVILESAWFEPKIIRATSKRHNLSTEASYRFERMVDPEITNKAAKLAIYLIKKLNPNLKIANPIIEIVKNPKPIKVKLDEEKINSLLGLSLSKKTIRAYLKRVGFVVKDNLVVAPSWRSDINIVEDLAEEVARIYSYDKLPKFKLKKKKIDVTDSTWHKQEQLKDFLSRLGFLEVYNYSFISKEDAEIFNLDIEKLLEVINPVDPDNKYLRTSLVPGLIKTIAKNQQESTIKAFEIGEVFNEEAIKKKQRLLKLGLVAYGLDENKFKDELKRLEKKLETKAAHNRFNRDSKKNNQIFSKYKIRKPFFDIVEFDLDKSTFNKFRNSLEMPPEEGFNYQKVSKYPEVSRDLAFVVNSNTNAKIVKKSILEINKLITRVELFDEFEHNKFGKNKKNIAYHIFFQASNRTLTDEEVNKIIKEIIFKIEKDYQAELRDQ